MEALGCHYVVELSKCNPAKLENVEKVKRHMMQAALVANAEIRETAFHQFKPMGVSGVVVIAESHLSIHTWPELGYAAVDIYTCGEKTSPIKACHYLAKVFESGDAFITKAVRGISDKNGAFIHKTEKVDLNSEYFLEEVEKVAKNKKLELVH